jgi:hypothetical protein
MVVADGMIIFPAFGVFAGLGGMGVSMFFVSCVLSVLESYCLLIRIPLIRTYSYIFIDRNTAQ